MMFKPSATYRIQFHKEFTFKHLDNLIPYFKELGVTTIYASPIFTAMPGSTHGYDVVNPHEINPEIGTEAELIQLSGKLKQHGISWIQDIVPNHMSFHPSNQWLMDVLLKWKGSDFFDFFDLDFPTKLKDKRLMVPFLGEDLEEAIQNSAVQLVKDKDGLYVRYGESSWPVNANFDLKDLQKINTDSDLLREVLAAQHYRLCHWQETEKQINYRRFFTVNSLICLNIQRPQVFAGYHQYIFKLVKLGVFQGLRIDHVDGLADPTQYLADLRKAVGEGVYIVVEKILGANERMPQNWPIEGNTGYDFLAMVNNLFTNRKSETHFTRLYKEIIRKPLDVAKLIALKKRAILFDYMQGELDHLVQLFIELNLPLSAHTTSFSNKLLRETIGSLLIYCPVYRFYGNEFPLADEERVAFKKLLGRIPKTPENKVLLSQLTEMFLTSNQSDKAKVAEFYQRCMQFSGPLMAKGVEDTLMYTYNRFIGHTEVGDSPDAFGLSIPEFHQKMQERLQLLPYSMNGTATHDTKRGEDVRARLNVLTDIPEKWAVIAKHWKKQTLEKNADHFGLHKNDAYLIFQTVLGTMPFTKTENTAFKDRITQYVEKALRETKKRSTWASPNEDYEARAKEFAVSLVNQSDALLNKFNQEIADFSIINSLAQLVLKFTCPGIPDIYQGTELWDLSLVDPDNRRPVDYAIRHAWLKEMDADTDIEGLWEERQSGKIKLWLTKMLLELRKTHQLTFEEGTYIPIRVEGKYSKHVIAFLRCYQNEFLLVAVPLGLAGIASDEIEDLRKFDWKDTMLIWPGNAPIRYTNTLTNEQGRKDIVKRGVLVKDLFAQLPIALLTLTASEKERSSGVLMPIFSLPSSFGIGDLGLGAYRFVDFLQEAAQKYWQLLPLNPVSTAHFNSPYASDSAMAGSKLFICPEFLLTDGLLSEHDLKDCRSKPATEVAYEYAREVKDKLLHTAYLNFAATPKHPLWKQFSVFCNKEDFWLGDYALYVALRHHHQGKPWNNWPKQYKQREPKALQTFNEQYASEIAEIKWFQFIFYHQWRQLKSYANAKGIEFIGDLPFYVAYDSADVWANQSVFKLDANLAMEVVAGVPPDSLCADGQLWGMPIYNWEYLHQTGFKWWLQRISKNKELFDVIRIDHFRAIHTYWEVPAEEETAQHGKWIEGPGASLLNTICKGLKELPFVVEDLGEEMEGPMELRDEFNLAGMKILQFAFGNDMPDSSYLPQHYVNDNCIAYIGTHDNNTVKGWFMDEIDNVGRERLRRYVGGTVTTSNVHKVMIRMALSTTAKIAIIQMQDLLGLSNEARMNTPGTTVGNWLWRMKKDALDFRVKSWFREQTLLFGRG
jgi:malto-oligosyltrehalose synthase/4-alpha-glucanotransferase